MALTWLLETKIVLRLHACGASACHPEVKVRITKNFDLFLVNESSADLQLAPCEIFGFGLGQFSEKLSLTVGATPPDTFPWLLKQDTTTLIHQPDSETRLKKPTTLASLFCHMASTHGIMDVTVTDHNVSPLCGASGEALMFRYDVKPKSKVACLTPKTLDDNLMALRATVVGAAFAGKFDFVPKTDAFRVCWEAAW